MVVPRSANKLAADDEFNLFAVTTFKKHSNDFVHKCREKRWTPREYKYKEGGKEEEAKETDQLLKDEKKLWGEALRLGRTGYSESAMIWVHVMALRVFVETVLRYGLPLDFVCGIVQVRHLHPFSPPKRHTDNHRQTPKQRKKQKRTSMQPTRTSAATHLAAITRAASRRMTRPCRRICSRRDTWAIRNIVPLCTTSLRLYSRQHWRRGKKETYTNVLQANFFGIEELYKLLCCVLGSECVV
jgi:hypothetical protein